MSIIVHQATLFSLIYSTLCLISLNFFTQQVRQTSIYFSVKESSRHHPHVTQTLHHSSPLTHLSFSLHSTTRRGKRLLPRGKLGRRRRRDYASWSRGMPALSLSLWHLGSRSFTARARAEKPSESRGTHEGELWSNKMKTRAPLCMCYSLLTLRVFLARDRASSG